MTIWDDRILEIISQEGTTSAAILSESDSIHISRSQISRRLKKLAEHEMLDKLPNGVYSITEKGEAYLDEEYDAEKEEYIEGGATADEENGGSASSSSLN
jgi:Mn-dependent DtxR family transcriptional regulator